MQRCVKYISFFYHRHLLTRRTSTLTNHGPYALRCRNGSHATAVISLAVIAWLFLTIIIILYVLWLFNVGPRIPPLVETICFIIIALLWLIIGILFSAQVREGNSDLSYLKTVQALSWIAFVLSVASAVVAFFAKGN